MLRSGEPRGWVAAPPPRGRRPGDAIAPPPQVDPDGAAALWANLAGTLTPSRRRRLLYGTPHVVWQYTWTGRQLPISVWVPGTVPAGAVEAAVRGAWPGATVTTTDAADPPIPQDVDCRDRWAPAAGGRRSGCRCAPTTTPTRCAR